MGEFAERRELSFSLRAAFRFCFREVILLNAAFSASFLRVQYTRHLCSRRIKRRPGLRQRLLHLPDRPANPPLGIASRAAKLIQQPVFRHTTIPLSPQPVSAHYFTLRALN